jgi:5-methylcytosine-specific restriction endonuclease McrA
MDLAYKQFIERWLSGLETGMKGKTSISCHIRKYLFELHKSKCQLCGWSQVSQSTGKVPLEIDHKDGDYRNNRIENLQLICPNCHSLTATYKSQNKGKGRNRKYYI